VAGAVDWDVHPHLRTGIEDLEPFVESLAWKHRMGLGADLRSWKEIPGFRVSLPGTQYVNPGGPLRPDTIPPDGSTPASDPEYVRKDLLDRYGLSAAVLIGGNILGLGGVPNPDLAAEFAAAHNRWTASVWLEADPRFRGSITVAPQAPDRALAEVEAWAGHPQFVQVFVPDTAGLALGNRALWPLYEAAQHHGLVIATHPGGSASGANFGRMFAGSVPTTFYEYHVGMPLVPMNHLTSLVAEGVFEQFGDLMFALVEAGFAWLPHLLWRLDKDWKSFREEVPWLKRLPSEYVVDHVRLTTQPMYEPDDSRHLEMILELSRADGMLMFSTDYPHYDTDDPAYVWRKLPEEMRPGVLSGTAQALFSSRAAATGSGSSTG
jgi:predicted TIM-barrel fold metal-dependent hydrolase